MSSGRKRSFLFKLVFLPLAAVVAVIASCNLWVLLSTKGRVYATVEVIGEMPAGLVLGTTRKISPDESNPHFDNRLKAAAALFHAGKVRHLLVSGHRESQYYDEPRDMTARLVELGVPASAITPDAAGRRTLDSIVRAREIYGLDRLTVISDDFHVGRAVFIADRKGIEAIALRCDPVTFRDSLRVRVREYFARVKAVIDLYLLNTQPTEMGEPRTIPVNQ